MQTEGSPDSGTTSTGTTAGKHWTSMEADVVSIAKPPPSQLRESTSAFIQYRECYQLYRCTIIVYAVKHGVSVKVVLASTPEY